MSPAFWPAYSGEISGAAQSRDADFRDRPLDHAGNKHRHGGRIHAAAQRHDELLANDSSANNQNKRQRLGPREFLLLDVLRTFPRATAVAAFSGTHAGHLNAAATQSAMVGVNPGHEAGGVQLCADPRQAHVDHGRRQAPIGERESRAHRHQIAAGSDSAAIVDGRGRPRCRADWSRRRSRRRRKEPSAEDEAFSGFEFSEGEVGALGFKMTSTSRRAAAPPGRRVTQASSQISMPILILPLVRRAAAVEVEVADGIFVAVATQRFDHALRARV